MAVYSSDWYMRDIKKVGVYVQMITARASKPVTFSGGGLFLVGRILWFNVNQYLQTLCMSNDIRFQILKTSFSVFTLLTSLK